MTIENERREKKKKKKKKKNNNFGRRRRSTDTPRFFIIEKYQPKNLSVLPFFLRSDRRGTKKIFSKQTDPFILCVKIIIASATRFAAFGAEKEEREKETRASSYLLRRERERESFCRAIHRLSKKRFEQNDYLILSRLTVCACVGFAVEIL